MDTSAADNLTVNRLRLRVRCRNLRRAQVEINQCLMIIITDNHHTSYTYIYTHLDKRCVPRQPDWFIRYQTPETGLSWLTVRINYTVFANIQVFDCNGEN